jgi:hypothetical protein
VLFTLLTWAALLCTGLGGSLGLASQNLASKLATPAQHLQRPAGTTQATRAARQDLPAATATCSFASGWSLVPGDFGDSSALPAGGFIWRGGVPRGPPEAAASCDVRGALRDPAHPCRAPPLQA